MTHYPAVLCCPENVYPGYGPRWQEEIEAILSLHKPFYMVFIPGDFTQEPADTRLRALWLKANKVRLSEFCKCIISIEPDKQLREQMIAKMGGLEKAFGVPRRVTASLAEAKALGGSLVIAKNWQADYIALTTCIGSCQRDQDSR